MRKLLVLVMFMMLIVPFNLLAQEDFEDLINLPFFLFEPEIVDAKSAAMGRTTVLTTSGSNAIFTNPASLGMVEDKVLQASVRKVIEPIYEEDFKPFSYGFRPGCSQHQAIEFMFQQVSFQKMHYIIDADIKNYFGSINHGMLRAFLDKRVKDGIVRRMIDKWLKAGVMEAGNISYSDH